jgi:hypothetical protein
MPTEKNPPAAPPADDLADLRAENVRLRAELEAAGATRTATPRFTFQLSEGDRQELELRGVVSIGGRLMTKADVEAAMADAGQRGVTIADAPEATRIDPGTLQGRTGPGVEGTDYVYPSVERGKIDPKVAGTPGISGPAADAPAKG